MDGATLRAQVRTACAIVAVSWSSTAYADDKDVARAAYARGSAALENEDYTTAAREFLTADEAVASDPALTTALQALLRVDDTALAARALNRTSSHSSEKIAEAAARVRAKYAASLARVRLVCRPAPCSARVGDASLAVDRERWVSAGAVVVTAVPARGAERTLTVEAAAGALTDVVVEAVAEAPALSAPVEVPAHARGLSPWWFWVGVGATAVLAGIATWSTIDVLGKHDDFESAHCATGPVPSSACNDIASSGKSADVRTVVLWGATGVALAITGATGAFWVKWHADTNGGGARLVGRFR